MSRSKSTHHVKIRDLMDAGYLKPGDDLHFEPRGGEPYTGQIERDGSLTLGGEQFPTPSNAATTLARRSGKNPNDSRNGWKEILCKGKSLSAYRDDYATAHASSGSPLTVSPNQPPNTSPPHGAMAPSAPERTPASPVDLQTLVSQHHAMVEEKLRDALTNLSADQFEHFVAAFLERLGYTDVRGTGGPGDKNIDVTARYPAPFMETNVRVQVKHRRSAPNIGPSDVAAFRDRAGDVDHSLIMVTNAEFTDGASETAAEDSRQMVNLIGGHEIVSKMMSECIGVRRDVTGILDLDDEFWSQF